MLRLNTTVVAIVGADASEAVSTIEARNIRTVTTEPSADPLNRAVEAVRAAAKVSTPWLLHDADPLEAVCEAWADRWDNDGPAGEMEMKVLDLQQRWRAGSVDLPDYYLVLDPESLSRTVAHWYLGFLAQAAPLRVHVTPPGSSVVGQLSRLKPCRWWPELPTLLADLHTVVPDLVGTRPAPPEPELIL